MDGDRPGRSTIAETPAQRRRRLKKERSRAAKERRGERRGRRRFRGRSKRVALTTVTAVIVIGLAGGLWYVTGRESRAAAARLGDLVVSEPQRGRDHVPSTTTEAAPTSGNHQAGAVCGVYDRVMTADQQIHTLEHGAIAYQYRPDDVEDTDVEALAELAEEFGSHVLVAPNPDLEAPFVATAWTRKMRLDEVDIDKARDFGVAFTGNGPESVACPLN